MKQARDSIEAGDSSIVAMLNSVSCFCFKEIMIFLRVFVTAFSCEVVSSDDISVLLIN